jgi:hypothetical protein
MNYFFNKKGEFLREPTFFYLLINRILVTKTLYMQLLEL